MRGQLRFWTIGFALAFAFLWLFSGILLPFVAGLAIAYLLDPLADRLEEWRLPRGLASAIAVVLFMVVAVGVMLMIVPILYAQGQGLVARFGEIRTAIEDVFMPWSERLVETLGGVSLEDLRAQSDEIGNRALELVTEFASGLLVQGLAMLELLGLLVVTPIVAFYLLRDFDKMIAALESWLPLEHKATIKQLLHEMDRALSGFVRGQLLVATMLGLFYAISLPLAGLNSGFLIGILAGVFSLLPYLGYLIGLVLSVGLAAVQFDSLIPVLIVAAIFVVGQIVEGNILSPKLVGDRTGLHAVWVIFAVMAGASLFGLVGVLLAVPVAAVLGVLTRFSLRQYLNSRYFDPALKTERPAGSAAQDAGQESDSRA